jgi:hypothetical protein
MRRFLLLAALATTVTAGAAATAAADDNPNNPAVFPPRALAYGADLATWGERASNWVWGQPLDQSPLVDPTGAHCAVGQEGPVWYIARISGPPVFSGERSCTIPHGKALLLYIGAVVDDYPCPPQFHFEPAPGQSLYDFLIDDARAVMDTVNFLEVSLDGVQLNDPMSYRVRSDDLFDFRADPSMRVLDPCITGSVQPAVIDGFFMMFKPPTRGEHTIVVHGTATGGDDKRFTYHLTIE